MNSKFSFFLFLLSSLMFAQQIEIGPTIGYGFDNIVDRKSDKKRAVIGDALGKANYGFSAFFYFNSKQSVISPRINLFYKFNTRGSKSEIFSDNRFEIDSNTFGLTGGVARTLGSGFSLYFDAGFGYIKLKNSDYYKGNEAQTDAFPDLNEPIDLKTNQVTFIYDFGFDKKISERLKVFLELNGDASISKLNNNRGSYGIQSIGFGTGIRYVFNLKKQEISED